MEFIGSRQFRANGQLRKESEAKGFHKLSLIDSAEEVSTDDHLSMFYDRRDKTTVLIPKSARAPNYLDHKTIYNIHHYFNGTAFMCIIMSIKILLI